jgi:hypothetical protein
MSAGWFLMGFALASVIWSVERNLRARAELRARLVHAWRG